MSASDDPSLTLAEGLARYFRANAGVLTTRDVSEGAAAFFRCHDVAHVVFGCDTSLYGEGTVKLWTIFGTTLGLRGHLRGYAEAGAFALFRQYGWRHVVRNTVRLIPSVPATIRRARAMRAPWPWEGHEDLLDRTLTDLRAEFGIELARR